VARHSRKPQARELTGRGKKAMIQKAVERRSEFRFPMVVPVEYLEPDAPALLSYTLNLSKNGTFLSSDNHPLGTGIRFRIHLNLPFEQESSRIFRTEGTVVWNRAQPFKSKRNGMGIRLIEPLPESLLLNALANNIKRQIEEAKAKKPAEEKVERLESELKRVRRLVVLGSCAERILFELSNPILALSRQLEIIQMKMHEHERRLEEHGETDERKFKKITRDFDKSCSKIENILKDYRKLSELVRIVRYDRETLQRRIGRKFKQ
jgi:hypothetical protein